MIDATTAVQPHSPASAATTDVKAIPEHSSSQPATPASTEPETSRSDDGSSNLTRLLVVGAAVGLGLVLMKQMPDSKRYLRMRSM